MITSARNTAVILGCPHDTCSKPVLCFDVCRDPGAERGRVEARKNVTLSTVSKKTEEASWEIPTPRKYLAIKYASPPGVCKCGECHLVPPEMLMAWEAQIKALVSELKEYREKNNEKA